MLKSKMSFHRAVLMAASALALGSSLLFAQSGAGIKLPPEAAIDPALAKFMEPGKKTGSGRVLFGTETKPDAYPFQVGVIRDESSLCGGSLIRDDWVLTAAHCVTVVSGGQSVVAAPTAFDVYVGSNQLTKGDRIKVTAVYRHPDYLPAFTDNDVALLKLERAPQGVRYDKIRTVTAANEAAMSASGTRMRIIGWGKTEEGKITTNLRESSVQMVDRATCNSNIVSSRLVVVLGELQRLRLNRDKLEEFIDKIGRYAGPLVTDSMICAGVPDAPSDRLVTDTCNGDSGGPLFTQASDGNWIQVGVVSWGEGCGQPKLHGVYTRLGKFASWINSTIK
jgi:secreted trypsin-like serine protease